MKKLIQNKWIGKKNSSETSILHLEPRYFDYAQHKFPQDLQNYQDFMLSVVEAPTKRITFKKHVTA